MDVWLPQSWLRHAGSRWWGLPSPYVNQLKRLMRRNAHWCHAFILALQGWVLTSYSRTYGRFGFNYNWWGPTLHASLWLIDARGSAESKAITLMPSTGVWQNMLPCSRMMGWDPKVGMAYGSPKQLTTWEEETWAFGFWSWFDSFCFDDYWHWVLEFILTKTSNPPPLWINWCVLCRE